MPVKAQTYVDFRCKAYGCWLELNKVIQCLPLCGLFSPFVRTARFWVTEWGNQILTNMNIVGIDVLYKPQ